MGWVYLAAAITFEILATSMLKMSHGLTRLLPTLLIFPLYGASFVGLSLALKSVELSAAYAIWSAVGTAAISAIGMFWFQESISTLKLVSITLVIIGVVGLNLSSAPP
jgi:small multidrug resistance pump